VLPTDAAVTAETIETDFLLFEDKSGNSDVVNVDKTAESIYIDRDIPQDAAALILKNVVPAGNKQPYEEFSKKFDEYRIWIPNLRKLLLPNFEEASKDNLKAGPGQYVGGEKAFKDEVQPYVKETDTEEGEAEEPSLGGKIKGKAPEFRPGTKPIKPTQGEVVDEGDTALKTAYDRAAAMRVVAQVTSTSPAAVQTSVPTTTTTGKKMPSIPISPDPKTNQQSARMLQELAKTQEKMRQTQQTVMRQVGTSGQTSTGTPGKY
jgi:hypothetical protein